MRSHAIAHDDSAIGSGNDLPLWPGFSASAIVSDQIAPMLARVLQVLSGKGE